MYIAKKMSHKLTCMYIYTEKSLKIIFFCKPNVKALTKAVKGFGTLLSIMWPINGLETIQTEILKNHKNEKQNDPSTSFFDGPDEKLINIFIWPNLQ